MVASAALERDGLPDAGERPVPALLPEGNLGEGVFRVERRVVGGCGHEHGEFVRAGSERAGDIEGEGQVPALVAADLDAVEEHDRVIIDGAEAQKHRAAVEPALRQLEAAAVPGAPGPLAQIGEFCLPGRRNRAFAPCFNGIEGYGLVAAKGKIPPSVERQHLAPHEYSVVSWRGRLRRPMNLKVLGDGGAHSEIRPAIAERKSRPLWLMRC